MVSLDYCCKKKREKREESWLQKGWKRKIENKQYLEAFGLWITINSRSRTGKQR